MKSNKIFAILLICLTLLIISGCGKDKEDEAKKLTINSLSCENLTDENGKKTTIRMYFDFDKEKDEIIEGNMMMKIDYKETLEGLSDDQKVQTESLMKSMYGNSCTNFENDGYINCESNYDDGVFKVTMDFDLNVISLSTDNQLKKNSTLKQVEGYFKQQGFDCEIR